MQEELGVALPGVLRPLGDIRQTGGKRVTAFSLEGDIDATEVRSNEFELEWPPRSGRFQSFPEIDRAQWFALNVAREKILSGQRPLLDRLKMSVDGETSSGEL
jgi:predicted NUDIX family NTP pyrophosphohydrolase